MNVSANGKALSALTNELGSRWAELTNHWRDVKSREFEDRFLSELSASVERALPVLDNLQKLLEKVREDCE